MEVIQEEMNRRMRQFLMNSYLYYALDENVIEDHQYDWLCKRLVELMTKHPDIAKSHPYYDLCGGADASASGFYIKIADYPPEIVTTAFRMLWIKRKENPDFKEDFAHFISRWGRKIER